MKEIREDLIKEYYAGKTYIEIYGWGYSVDYRPHEPTWEAPYRLRVMTTPRITVYSNKLDDLFSKADLAILADITHRQAGTSSREEVS